jgi:hypothetical protein
MVLCGIENISEKIYIAHEHFNSNTHLCVYNNLQAVQKKIQTKQNTRGSV